jgi:hypothetical protein
VTQTIDKDYLDRIRNMRNDSAKDTGDESLNVVGMDLHNNI